jgi:hypothetical protein
MIASFYVNFPTEKLLLTNEIHYYPFQSQGKTDIPSVDDGAEFRDTDVSTYSNGLKEEMDKNKPFIAC